MTSTLERVTFRLNDGVSDEAFIKAAEDLNAWVKRQPGFAYRTLVKDEDGVWTDLLFWDSEDSAKAAAESFSSAPQAGPLMAMIREGSASMAHLPQRMVAMAGPPVPA